MSLLSRIEEYQRKSTGGSSVAQPSRGSIPPQVASSKKTPVYDPYKKKLVDVETGQEIKEEVTNEGQEFAEGRGPSRWNA